MISENDTCAASYIQSNVLLCIATQVARRVKSSPRENGGNKIACPLSKHWESLGVHLKVRTEE